jgi:ankyrin repeat protein
MIRTLEQVLASVSDVLFPAEIGEAAVTITSRSSEGDTALHVMAWRRDAEGARILIAAGADVDAVGDMDQTPLHVSVTQCDETMVGLLLKAGARHDLKSEFGLTARQEAERIGGAVRALFGQQKT